MDLPPPHASESATSYADRLGQVCLLAHSSKHRKLFGQYYTSVPVAEFMASLAEPSERSVSVLDPGAGSGILACALCEHLSTTESRPNRIEVVAVERDVALHAALSASLKYLEERLRRVSISLTWRIDAGDFVLDNSTSLTGEAIHRFDYVISNPPYFKVPKSDERAQAANIVVFGQPNIYSMFMAVSAALTREGGQLIFITPRSFASGAYFRRFREYYFRLVRPEHVHLFDSRKQAFERDRVLQEWVITSCRRLTNWTEYDGNSPVRVSVSRGDEDLRSVAHHCATARLVLDLRSDQKFLRVPASDDDEEVIERVDSWSGSLRAYGLRISTGPVVPFRATTLLAPPEGVSAVPLLWMQNVKKMVVEWPAASGKPQTIEASDRSARLLVPSKTYVLVRRMSSKEEPRRLTAAVLCEDDLGSANVGLENHLNYIYRPGGQLATALAHGLAAFLNSRIVDRYFRTINGNTQVSATEIEALPLPPVAVLEEIGRRFAVMGAEGCRLDELVEDMLA